MKEQSIERPEIKNLRHGRPKGPRQIRVDRKSTWGNPYKITRRLSREQVIKLYRHRLIEGCLEGSPSLTQLKTIAEAESLWCWCAPLLCHADALIDIALMAKASTKPIFLAWCRDQLKRGR